MSHDSDEQPGAPPIDDAYERLFIAAVGSVMAVALFVYVWKFGRNVPFWDDWELVPVLTGYQPFSLAWLWTPHNEHSMPVVRLVVYSVWRLTGDLRAVMAVTSAILCAGAGALVWTARRLRGRSAFSDAIFPVALLGWGLFENHIFAMQFFFVGSAMLVVSIVVLGVGDWRGSPVRVACIGICLVMLPMFGAIGLAMLPCALAWAAAAGLQSLRDGGNCSRREGAALLTACGLAAAVGIAYVIGFPPSSSGPVRATLHEIFRTSSEILATSIGQAGARIWPLSTIGTVGVVAAALVVNCRAVIRSSEARDRSLVLLAGMGSLLCLVVAISYGRGGLGSGQGFSNRYALFSAVLLCLSVLSFSVHETGGFGRLLRTTVLLALAAAFVTNSWMGIAYGIDRADRADALTEAIDAGAPTGVAAARHSERLYPVPSILAERLEMLRATRSGPYSRPQAFAAGSACREVSREVQRLGEHQIFVDGETFRSVGNDPFVVYALPRAEYVCGIRLRFTDTNASPEAPVMQVFWANSANGEFREGHRSTFVEVRNTTDVQEATVWVYDTIDRLRIDPDQQPGSFELRSITFLVRGESE